MTEMHADKVQARLGGASEQRLVTAFFVMIKTARLVDRENATYRSKLDDFCGRLNELSAEHGDVAFKVHNDRYFVNDRMVRLSDDNRSGADKIVEQWHRLGIGGVKFAGDVEREQVSQFFDELAELRPTDENLEEVAERLKNLGIDRIELLGMREEVTADSDESEHDPEVVRQQFRKSARVAFFKSLSTVQEVMHQAADSEDINVAKTKRVVHSLIDHLMLDESSLLELTALKDYDDYTYAHSTNVCIYSLTIGVRIGLDRARLSQLGMAAVFHDVGKIKLPKDLIRKPDAYDDNDWIQMQRHPLLGAKTLLRNLEFTMYTARAARGAFEHHINSDFTGYPQLRYHRRPTTLFSKIIAIADTFDALTSGRVYIKRVIPPDEVVKKMRFQMAIKFDPVLLKVFTDIIGIYPAGSLVLLSTEELALILTHNEDRTRPFVKIVGDRSGLLPEPVWADLSSPEHTERRILRLVEPEKHGINMQQLILQD
ncbi:HD domain-containing protein [candidate division GN15 bacterium]|nr:HD domain-containing protein [candidate division GN15 bacterium]